MAKYLKWNDNKKDEQSKVWIKEIQKSLGAYPDGLMGKQTLLELYKEFVDVEYPINTSLFNVDVLINKADNIQVLEIKNAHGTRLNQLSGSFQYNNRFNCISVNNGRVLGDNSAHYWANKPDTVLFYDGDKVRIRQIINVDDLPNNTIWAISGVGLNDFQPEIEGYSKFKFNGKSYNYSDVLRNTGHTAIGVADDGTVIGAYIKGNVLRVRDIMINKLKCKYAIMLDGGHIASINSEHSKQNISQKQHNVIQF